jgi:hypothetical protein
MKPSKTGAISVAEYPLIRALYRARYSILTIAATYALSVLVGVILVHSGNRFSLAYRDRIVGTAMQRDSSAIADQRGEHMRAALLDAAGNLVLGALPKSIAGLSIVLAYPMVAYQGWIGGIVSVRGDHSSRFDNWHTALYYLITLLLQIGAYSIAVGGGVNVGVAMFRPAVYYSGKKWLGLFQQEAVRDAGRLFLVAIPLFLVGSLWEFLSPWNI